MIMEVVVLGLLGLVAGVGLEIASRKFKEEEDEKVEAIREFLPGLNCGACGFAGCDQYSEELVKDPSKLGACVQVSEEEREEMAEILKIETEEVES